MKLLFHVPVTLFELVRGSGKGKFRVDPGKSRHIDKGEQNIPELVGNFFLVTLRDRTLKLFEFLSYLVQDIIQGFPVKPFLDNTFGHLPAFLQCGHA